jgi:uncharacterized membrane protein/protein-disulfide isomerase
MQSNLVFLVNKLLIANAIYIDQEELALQISSHPSYPSLHAITGVLSHFGIVNMAFEVPVSADIISELPTSFIAHFQNKEAQEDFVLVQIKKNKVLITNATNKKEKLTIAEFLSRWKGILVVVEKDTSIKTASKPNTWKQLPIVLLLVVVLYALATTLFMTVPNAIYILLMAVGTYISYLIIKHELGFNSQAIDSVCNGSEKTSCDAVLNSNGARILGLFKMSDVSLVYFASLLLASIVLILSHNSFISSLLVLGVLAIPVVAYSLFYQKFVVKKWCPLCLATIVILCCQIALAFWINPRTFTFDVVGFLIVLVSGLSVISLYSLIKPVIISKQKLQKEQVASLKFKRDFSLFNAIYQQADYLNTQIANLTELTFGNPDTKLKLTLITSPTCGFCKPKHQQAAQLLTNNQVDILLTIRFNISPQNKENPAYKIANILINIYQEDKNKCLEAMHKIYAQDSDIKKWLKQYHYYSETDQEENLKKSYDWCVANQINFTPAVYLNNKTYPKAYEIQEIALFADDISQPSLPKGKE